MGQIPRTLSDTLRGSGFLREAPQNVRAMMRRCMVVPHRQVLGAPVVPVSHRHRSYSFAMGPQAAPYPGPANPAPYQPAAPVPPPARAAEPRRAQQGRPVEPEALLAPQHGRPWWDDPVTIGALLVVMPPVGFSALWASRHYSKEGRWAISGMMALMLCLLAAVAVAFSLR